MNAVVFANTFLFRLCLHTATERAVEGEVHGFIAREARGHNGFGYDPLFFYPAFEKTFGEVSAEKKQEVSHRTKALEKVRALLEQYLANRV